MVSRKFEINSAMMNYLRRSRVTMECCIDMLEGC